MITNKQIQQKAEIVLSQHWQKAKCSNKDVIKTTNDGICHPETQHVVKLLEGWIK